MRKRPLILFELLIALSLVSILLALLFRFITNSIKVETKIEEARAALYPKEYLHTRLSSLFTALVPRSFVKNSSFYTLEQGGIAAIFDNGIDPDPLFSGAIRSKLTVEQGRLYLTFLPLEEENPQRKELLLSGVKAIRFQFLAKKNSSTASADARPISRTAEWRSSWSKECWDLPSLIRMTLELEENELSFAFSLPVSEPAVVYGDPR